MPIAALDCGSAEPPANGLRQQLTWRHTAAAQDDDFALAKALQEQERAFFLLQGDE